MSAYQVSYLVSLPDNGQLDVNNLLKTEAIVSHPKNIAHKFAKLQSPGNRGFEAPPR